MPPAMVGHLKIPNAWQRESGKWRVVNNLLQRLTPGIASKHDTMTVQDSRLDHTHFIFTTGRLRRKILLAPQGFDVGGRGLHCPEYAAQRAVQSTFFNSLRCLRGVHNQVEIAPQGWCHHSEGADALPLKGGMDWNSLFYRQILKNCRGIVDGAQLPSQRLNRFIGLESINQLICIDPRPVDPKISDRALL